MMNKNEVAKSPAILKKEKSLAMLRSKLKQVNTELKKNKTTLKKLEDETVEIAKRASSQGIPLVERAHKAQLELLELLRQASSSDKIGKEEKKDMVDLLSELEDSDEFSELSDMGDMDERARKYAEEHTDEFNRARAEGMFDEFRVKTSEKEQGEIRKVFIRLANQFHPDKAKTEHEGEFFHSLMQRINAAYERGDISELLDIQKRNAGYETGQQIDPTDASAIIDMMDQQIDTLKYQVRMLESQLKRVKKEISNIKYSPMGQKLEQEKRSVRHGGMTMEDELAAAEAQLVEMERTNSMLREYLETGVMPEGLAKLFEKEETPSWMMNGFRDDDDDDGFYLDEEDMMFDELSPQDVMEMMRMLERAMGEQMGGRSSGGKKKKKKK